MQNQINLSAYSRPLVHTDVDLNPETQSVQYTSQVYHHTISNPNYSI